MSMTPEVGKYYWIRLYRDDAEWRIALRYLNTQTLVWLIIDNDPQNIDSPYIEFYYDTEVNEVGPEIVPPPQ